jgi:Ca2+-binding RTX toxin-like protein
MKSLRLRSAIIASIASMLICTMLLGSVLITNVYAKGSGSEKSKYNLDENCKDDHKGKQITLTGSRSVENTETTTDNDAEVDKDAQRLLDDSGIAGRVNTDFDAFGQPIDIDTPDGTLGIFDDNKHIEIPTSFDAVIDPITNETILLALNPHNEVKQKDTNEFKKSLPLKERREFNVCGLPIGNIVDGFKFNEIDGTKKSDILLGTSAADDIKGKDGGDVIQARDDDDIVHAGKGDDSVQAGFGNDNIHADDGDDAVFAGPNDDYVNGGKGSDELYAQDGDDALEGGPGADFFDCGPGFDTVVDFSPNEGDITNDNCEDVRTNL